MKLTKLSFPLIIAVAAMLAATGCKHGPTKVTRLGDPNTQVGDGRGTPTLPPGNPLPPETGPGSGPGNTPTSDLPLDAFNQDRAALAEYTVHFALDSHVVKSGEQSKISSVAAALAANARDCLLIEGHCDERGTEEYNRALGERRALALREALAKAGVDPMRVRTLTFGKDKPVEAGHNEAAWSKNRRGEFILLHPK